LRAVEELPEHADRRMTTSYAHVVDCEKEPGIVHFIPVKVA
jgi:hypothetical protein